MTDNQLVPKNFRMHPDMNKELHKAAKALNKIDKSRVWTCADIIRSILQDYLPSFKHEHEIT